MNWKLSFRRSIVLACAVCCLAAAQDPTKPSPNPADEQSSSRPGDANAADRKAPSRPSQPNAKESSPKAKESTVKATEKKPKEAEVKSEPDEPDGSVEAMKARSEKRKAKQAEAESNQTVMLASAVVSALLLGLVLFLILRRHQPQRYDMMTKEYGNADNEDNRLLRKEARGVRSSTQIDEYHLVHRIHGGQNAVVWEVFDAVTNDHLAMKILSEDKGWDTEYRKVLRHEWEVGSKLAHPNLIGFRRFVSDESTAYIIMDFFGARNLKRRILQKQHTFLIRNSRNIMKQVMKGVAYLHAQNWVHRDIKPANILVNNDGHARLIDFGLAEHPAKYWQRHLPNRPIAQGTISYISPEQIRGERVDDRTDIYCLGATFFELVTGRPPFTGKSPGDLLNKHLIEEAPSAQMLNPDVSDEFALLLKWMLEKKPEHRPPEVNVLLLRLKQTPLFRTDAAQAQG
jgi:hypothetical protein